MSSTRCLLAALALLALPLAANALGALDRVKASRTLAVAYDPHAYPLSFKDDLDKPAGYTPDLCRRVATAIQRDLGLPGLAIKWIEGNTPRRLAAVVNGEADLDCATTTLTLERQRQVDFSNVVFIESGAILIREGARTHARGYADLADLAEGRLGVVPETTTERRLRRVLRLRSINMQLVPIKDAKDGREQLLAGTLDAVAGDRLVLLGQIETSGASDLTVLEADYSLEPYAFALPRNDADFRLAVNASLAEVFRGRAIDRIFARWFGEGAEPSELLAGLFAVYGFVD